MKPKIHAGHVEVAVANLLNYRKHMIVPNVSWGLGLFHECDLLALDEKLRFTEVEIKVTKSDLLRDFQKSHAHKSSLISRLVFAVPSSLTQVALEVIPADCGLIEVTYNEHLQKHQAKWVRIARYKKNVVVPPKTVQKFLHLGCMRIWSLKEINYKK